MKRHLTTLARHLAGAALVGAMALPALAHAQMASGPTLYEQLGGKPAIAKVVNDMYDNVLADPRIKQFFAKTNPVHIKMELTNQVCEATGGPCKYTGQTMRQAHKGMNINQAQFNALVEDLQKSMDTNRVPLGLQNQLLAILAPMEPHVDHQ
jgi:hemoglobin